MVHFAGRLCVPLRWRPCQAASASLRGPSSPGAGPSLAPRLPGPSHLRPRVLWGPRPCPGAGRAPRAVFAWALAGGPFAGRAASMQCRGGRLGPQGAGAGPRGPQRRVCSGWAFPAPAVRPALGHPCGLGPGLTGLGVPGALARGSPGPADGAWPCAPSVRSCPSLAQPGPPPRRRVEADGVQSPARPLRPPP